MSLRPNARGMRDPAGNEGMGHFVRLAHRCATVEASQRDSHGALCDARIIRTPPLRPIPYDSGKFNFAVHLNHLLLRPYDDCVADVRAKSPDQGSREQAIGTFDPATHETSRSGSEQGSRAEARLHRGVPVIRSVGLSKRYGDFSALKDLDLEVAQGEVISFLGPNGAGKATTIRLLPARPEWPSSKFRAGWRGW